MTTIYVVTSGDYSNYQIDGVFDDKELAEKFKEEFRCDEIEEYPLNPFKIEKHSDCTLYCVEMAKDGTTHNIKQDTSRIGLRTDEEPFGFRWDKTILWNYVFAKDKKHAVKITNELRVRLIASEQWPK